MMMMFMLFGFIIPFFYYCFWSFCFCCFIVIWPPLRIYFFIIFWISFVIFIIYICWRNSILSIWGVYTLSFPILWFSIYPIFYFSINIIKNVNFILDFGICDSSPISVIFFGLYSIYYLHLYIPMNKTSYIFNSRFC